MAPKAINGTGKHGKRQQTDNVEPGLVDADMLSLLGHFLWQQGIEGNAPETGSDLLPFPVLWRCVHGEASLSQ